MNKDQFCQLKKGDIIFYVTEEKIYTAKVQNVFQRTWDAPATAISPEGSIYIYGDVLVDLSFPKEPPGLGAAICGTIHLSEAETCFASYPEANVYLQGLLVKKLERVVNNLTEFFSSQKG